jgi:hypothetical protein
MKTRFDLDDFYPELTRVETTVGNNGYPLHLQYAYYCDSKKETEEIIEDLRNHGHEVQELYLRRRNGHQLWNRELRDHSLIKLDRVGEYDWAITLDMNGDEEDIKSDILTYIIGEDLEYIDSLGDEVNLIVEDFYSDIKRFKGKGFITVFYDPDNGNYNMVDYVITEDCTGYHDGDVTSYQMAFTVYEKEEDDETKSENN